MTHVRTSLLSVAVLAAAGVSAIAAPAAVAAPSAPAAPATTPRGDYDARAGGSPGEVAAIDRNGASVSASAAVTTFRAGLGAQGLVEIDGLTGTPRQVTKLDGLLTPASKAKPAEVALGYVRAHADIFRLSATDLAGLTLRKDYVDIAGVHHLSFTQAAGGVPLFGNGLQAAVTSDGRLVTVFGSPVAGLAAPATPTTTAVADGSKAVSIALTDLHNRTTTPVAGVDVAHRVLFRTPGGVRSAWETVTMSATRPAVHVVDAASGRVLFRQSITSDADPTPASPTRPAATGKAFDYFPSAPKGGTTHDVDYTANGWLPATAKVLAGNNSHAYSDVNDDNKVSPSEEVPPTSGTTWNYVLKPIAAPYSFCGNPYPCTWNPDVPYSWKTNRAQNTAQVFYFVNTWHDFLAQAPIGFTEDAGNFQKVNASGSGLGGDPVKTETEDGANTDNGLPDANHIDNANMSTPPDGTSPRMQMYLQHEPGTTYPDGDPFAPTDVGDEADTVYHEYTHGLSGRLVVDANGVSTLGNVEAGAMGEAWSDWYAMDYLVAAGLQADTAKAGDVVLFQFDGEGVKLDRTEPIDCPVGTTSVRCKGTPGAGSGGYTYGDYGKVRGYPEVHSDGEIWAQTLWDLRAALGSTLSESLVTRAMELSPANPSFLDQRNAILTADNAIYGGKDDAKIWKVFAHRGMGWFAGALSGDDSAPAEDFSLPPSSTTPKGTLAGRVVAKGDARTPVANAVVSFGGHGAAAAGGYAATTGADGRYAISGIFAGTYPKVTASAPGYDAVSTTLSVSSGTTTKNFVLVQDLAAASGGATVRSFTGPDYTDFGCGPVNLIDQSLGSGWGSESTLVNGKVGPDTAKQVVVRLPRAVDVGTIAIDPNGTCGDDGTAGVAGWSIEFSTNGTTWQLARSGTFTAADNGHLNRFKPAGTTGQGVQYFRFTAKGPQAVAQGDSCPSSGDSGCDYLDVSEVALYAPGV